MRIAFLGTPDFALPSLRMLLEEGYEVAGVFTQPDKPVGRSGKLKAPPVKVFAQERGIPVCQPARIRSEEGLAALRALQPDLMVTAAFGQILSGGEPGGPPPWLHQRSWGLCSPNTGGRPRCSGASSTGRQRRA